MSLQGLGQTWQLLPDNILLKVFSLLEESDLVHASSVCSRWRKWFHEPRFWRNLVFNFNTFSEPKVDLAQKLNVHLLNIGKWAEHVTIVCPSKQLLVQRQLAECVKVILVTLACVNQTIKTFRLKQLQMAKHWKGFDLGRCDIISSLCHFFESQTCLQTVVTSKAFLPTTFGHMVMSSLARSPSVDTLQQLDIFYLFAFYLWRSKKHRVLVLSNIGKFHKLEELTVNFAVLKGLNIKKLCEVTKHSLKLLLLKNRKDKRWYEHEDDEMLKEVDRYHEFATDDDKGGEEGIGVEQQNAADSDQEDLDESRGIISPRRWREAAQINPTLRVAVELTVMDYYALHHLVPCIPISSITLRDIESLEDEESDRDINAILKHLSRCSWDTLESATFLCLFSEDDFYHQRGETKKEEVVDFIRKHGNIQSVKFSSNLMKPSLLEEVKSELVKRHHDSRDVLSIL